MGLIGDSTVSLCGQATREHHSTKLLLEKLLNNVYKRYYVHLHQWALIQLNY